MNADLRMRRSRQAIWNAHRSNMCGPSCNAIELVPQLHEESVLDCLQRHPVRQPTTDEIETALALLHQKMING
jgi:hypothetical protein